MSIIKRILYLTAEGWPTHRADLAILCGKYLPRFGLSFSLLTERTDGGQMVWMGGEDLTFSASNRKSLFYIIKMLKLLIGLIRIKNVDYDAIQVRDMPVVAFIALIIAKLKRVPFFYWMSFPQSEGQIIRAKSRGPKAGMRFWFPLIQGTIGKFLLYKVVFLYADHIFVQSDRMLDDVASLGVPRQRLTSVPMGVDTESTADTSTHKSQDARLLGKRVLVYLGTMDPVRQIDILFTMLKHVLEDYPDALLLLVGDTEDTGHREWLKKKAIQQNVEHAIIWTGWLSMEDAWAYVRASEIGLSPCPRGFLFDCASPTKAVEYMAIGLPVVGNDNPDQALVIRESGAGICVKLNEQELASAVCDLFKDKQLRVNMGVYGKAYIEEKRSYLRIAEAVAAVYMRLLKK